MTERALRLLVYDRTCLGPMPRDSLSVAWRTGSLLYRALGRLDASFAAASWSEALEWLGSFRSERSIGEIQYWGHGRWGRVMIGRQPLDRTAFRTGHPLHAGLARVRARLLPERNALVWLRTCEAFGSLAGHAFACEMAEFFRCSVAGHTHVIGFWQSGLHRLRPGEAPSWSPLEGIAQGTVEAPVRALSSTRGAPHTLSCLEGRIPDGW